MRAKRGDPQRGQGGAGGLDRDPGRRRPERPGRHSRTVASGLPSSRATAADDRRSPRSAAGQLVEAAGLAHRQCGASAGCCGDDTPDTGCGLKLFPRALFLDLPYFDHMHRLLPALVLREGGMVRSVPVNHRPRRAGRRNTACSIGWGRHRRPLRRHVAAAAAPHPSLDERGAWYRCGRVDCSSARLASTLR